MLSAPAWKTLERVNLWVNTHVKPMTDMDHWGVVERWNYPDDGYGDCEDYVLLKRRMLMQAGWPREALLITVVRDKRGDGHAILTVKTDKGEYILDNQNDQNPALVGHRLPLRQAAVASRPECVDCARRAAQCAGDGHLALIDQGVATPVTSPPLPVPRPGSRGRLFPRSRPHLFSGRRKAEIQFHFCQFSHRCLRLAHSFRANASTGRLKRLCELCAQTMPLCCAAQREIPPAGRSLCNPRRAAVLTNWGAGNE